MKCSPEKLEYNRLSRKKNRERLRQFEISRRTTKTIQKKLWRQRNPERAKAIQDRFYRNNSQSLIKRNKEYLAKIAAENNGVWKRRMEYVKGWGKRNKVRLRVYGQRWVSKNKEKTSAYCASRRARIAGAQTDRFINHVIASMKLSETFVCYYCGSEFPIKKLHIDHVVPLSKGGPHTCENICMSCVSCNCKKSDKIITKNE